MYKIFKISLFILLLTACNHSTTTPQSVSLSQNICPQEVASADIESKIKGYEKEAAQLTQIVKKEAYSFKLPAGWTINFDDHNILGKLNYNEKEIGNLQVTSYNKEESPSFYLPNHASMTACVEMTTPSLPVRYARLEYEQPAGAPDQTGIQPFHQFILYDRHSSKYNFDYIFNFSEQDVDVALAYAIISTLELTSE